MNSVMELDPEGAAGEEEKLRTDSKEQLYPKYSKPEVADTMVSMARFLFARWKSIRIRTHLPVRTFVG